MTAVTIFRPAALAAVMLLAATTAVYAGQDAANTINVTLWDKGADAEMKTDMGLGMSGDHNMSNMGLKLSQDQVKAGDVTFKVTNTSKDTVHEMIVIPYPASGKLPYSDKDARFDEDAAKSQGEVSELDPGKAGSVTLKLSPGKYILSCNVPNHFANGMWTTITVTQ
jgi:uncharacterized cupredoxin-like copper-binding protein